LELLKSIITLERIDLIHCHQIPSGKVAVTAAEQMNVPFVFTVHGAYYDSDFIQILRRSSNIICVSPSIQRLLLTNAIESSLIPNGLDVLEYQPRHSFYREYLRNKLAIPKHAFVVMYAGRLSWEKADICEDIIHLASVLRLNECPNLHLIIAGGGKKQENIIKLAEKQQQQMGTPFIHCVGELTDMCAYYCISDCIIGTGRIALEAMACERPLIAVGTRGFLGFVQPELYEKAWDCWFGDHDSPEPLSKDELAHHIKSLLYLDPKKKSEMALAGRNFIVNRFHISRTTEKLIDLYHRVTMSKTKTNSK
jgi:glycosyltransferase involved in cell wall biosynthesis